MFVACLFVFLILHDSQQHQVQQFHHLQRTGLTAEATAFAAGNHEEGAVMTASIDDSDKQTKLPNMALTIYEKVCQNYFPFKNTAQEHLRSISP